MTKENNHRHKVMNEGQCKQFLAHCTQIGTKGAIALYLSLSTGMRISEVISLKTDDINFANREIKIMRTKNGTNHLVPLVEEVAQVLLTYMENNVLSEFVFPSNRTKNGYIASPRKTFHRIMSMMRLSGYYIHDLRRSYAALLLQKTNDIQLVCQTLNHHSITTTQRYARYDTTEVKKRLLTKNLFHRGDKSHENILNEERSCNPLGDVCVDYQ